MAHRAGPVWGILKKGAARLSLSVVCVFAIASLPSAHAARQTALPEARDLARDAASASASATAEPFLLMQFSLTGCAYCEIVRRTQTRHLVDTAIDGHPLIVREVMIDQDRAMTGPDGARTTHRAFAKSLGVDFAPTVLVLDREGKLRGAPLIGSGTEDYYGFRLDRMLRTAIAGQDTVAPRQAAAAKASAVNPAAATPAAANSAAANSAAANSAAANSAAANSAAANAAASADAVDQIDDAAKGSLGSYSLPMDAIRLAPRSWFVRGGAELGSRRNGNFISNAGFVVTDDSVVVVDALGSPAAARGLLAAIRRVTDKPVSHVILTHYHADHIYGLQVLKAAGARVIAGVQGREYLNSESATGRLAASRSELAPWIDKDTRLVPADEWIDAPRELKIGGMRFLVEPVGPAHTPEDLSVLVPDEKLLFAGDIAFSNRVPYVGKADSRHWVAAVERLMTRDLDLIVPGHGPESRNAASDLKLTRDYLKHLRTTMGEAARNLEPFDEAYAKADWSAFEKLPLFREANRMNAYNTYLLMEQESLQQ